MSDLARIDSLTLVGIAFGFTEKQAEARDEIERRLLGARECAKAFAERGDEITALQANLTIAKKAIEASKRLERKLSELSSAQLNDGIPLMLANDIGILHLELHAALAAYDLQNGDNKDEDRN